MEVGFQLRKKTYLSITGVVKSLKTLGVGVHFEGMVRTCYDTDIEAWIKVNWNFCELCLQQ